MPLKIKRWSLCLAVVAGLIPLTCGSGSSFDVSQPSTAAVPSGNSTSSLAFPDYTALDLGKNAAVSKQKITADQFQSVRLLTFSLTGAQGADLSFIQGIKFYIEGGGQTRQLIASLTSFEKGQGTRFLDVADMELGPYFKDKTITITNEATLSSNGQAVNVVAEPIFEVHVQNFPSACVR